MSSPVMPITPQKLETWFWRLVRLSLVILALPFAGIFFVVIKGGFDEDKALRRARSLTPTEREAIVAACAKLSRTIREDYGELRFEREPRGTGNPIPPEFAVLQPKRVRISRNTAFFILHFLVDSGVAIRCDGLDTPSPTATLSWGELGDKEPWVPVAP